jgi:hypothetical protein
VHTFIVDPEAGVDEEEETTEETAEEEDDEEEVVDEEIDVDVEVSEARTDTSKAVEPTPGTAAAPDVPSSSSTA